MKAIKEINMLPTSHVAIADLCRQFNIKQIVDKAMGWVETPGKPSPGDMVVYMVMDILNQRTPLYRIEEKLKDTDVEALFGPGITAGMFNDDRLGRMLDRFFETGARRIFDSIAAHAIGIDKVTLDSFHIDTTSVSVAGEYDNPSDEEDRQKHHVIKIGFGHSKDKRPDLKQYKIGLIVNREGIPIAGDIMDGSMSDKTWMNTVLKRIKILEASNGLLPILVADSALVTNDNLGELDELMKKGYAFISRCPDNYSVCKELRDEAISANSWKDLVLTDESDEKVNYKGQEFFRTINDITYRFVVLHSAMSEERCRKSLMRSLEKERKNISEQVEKFVEKEFSCSPDAQKALDEFLAKHKKSLFQLSGEVVSVQRQKRRPHRGRPRKDEASETEDVFFVKINVNEPSGDTIEALVFKDSLFVLITNLSDKDNYSMEYILNQYKGQIAVEQRFRFIKDEHYVNGVFLKNDTRIEALAYIILIAGLIAALAERRVRRSLKETKEMLPLGGMKKTKLPTAKSLFEELKEAAAAIVYKLPDFSTHYEWVIQDYTSDSIVGRILRHMNVGYEHFYNRKHPHNQ